MKVSLGNCAASAAVLALIACSDAEPTAAKAKISSAPEAPAEVPSIRLSHSEWKAKPSAADFAACSPDSTEVQGGTALLQCRVNADGGLENCQATSVEDDRLRDWSLCVAQRFRTTPQRAGAVVEIPLRWLSEG